MEERAAFFKIRDLMASEPVLAHPDFDSPFEVHTDASRKGIGATLCQKKAGIEHVIQYASRALTPAENNYAIWELEALAAVWACKLFKQYVLGTHFTLVMDSKAAKMILKTDSDNECSRILRW